MPTTPARSAERAVIRGRPHWRDIGWFVFGLFAILGSVLEIAQPDSWKDVAMGVFAIAFFAPVPVLNCYFLLRGVTVAVLDREGIRLFKESHPLLRRRAARARITAWSEVKQLVFWHRTDELRSITIRVTQLGIEPVESADTEGRGDSAVSEQQAEDMARMARAFEETFGKIDRRIGAPEHIGTPLARASIPIAASSRQRVADAVARFAPHVRVVDARRPRRIKVIEPRLRKRF